MTDNIWTLSDTAVNEMAALSPVEATYVGVEGYDHLWTDYSPDGIAAGLDYLGDLRRRIDALPDDPDPWAKRATQVARSFVDLEEGYGGHEDIFRAVRKLACPLSEVREVFDVMDLESVEGRESVIARLNGLSGALAGIQSTLEVGMGRGLVAARRQVEVVVEQCATNAGERSSLRALVPSMAENGASEAELGAAGTAAQAAAAAFGEVGTWLEQTYLPSAPAEDPVGRDRYAAASRYFLGLDVDLEETYHWGWSEVERIRADMEALSEEIEPGVGHRAVIELLNTDPARLASRDEFVRLMQERQDSALIELEGTHFDVPEPVKKVVTKLGPPGSNMGAYYISPSEDFSRPGSVWFSVGDHAQIPLWENVSTAYHEGFPGHHLQTGIQMSLAERTSRLQRVWVWYSGSGEGWALYSETLMRELGYFEKPEYVFGMLASEILRACRVAIDIGSHLGLAIPNSQPFHPGEAWSFDTAVEMLGNYAGLLPDYAAAEVTRYLGWPGQAPSYKIGERVILDLREERKAREGTAFDLKQFHADVLEAGPVGLGLLQEFVRSAGQE
ncbi:MAG: DUF885 domain-containing protein [Acidimicrobiia bacterium]|nr:DUF885 domain-containing protein [Acidimicrobiia bacterium]